MTADYRVVPEDEAEKVLTGTQSLWFTRLLDGTMLDMKQRQQLTKAQRAITDEKGLRLRSKQHEIDDETGYRFYVWLEEGPSTDEDMPEPPEG